MTQRAPVLPPPPSVLRHAVQGDRRSSPTAQTKPAMRAVRGSAPRMVITETMAGDVVPTAPPQPLPRLEPPSSRAPFVSLVDEEDDEEEEVTSVGRVTEAGAPPPMLHARNRAVLVRLDGALAGQTTSVGQDGVTIGRGRKAHVRADDEAISRQHARIVHQGGRYYVEDLGSSNGTYASGKRINSAALHDGDVVHIGPRVSYRFTLTDEKQEQLLRQLFESSTRDGLTGAYNRQHFDERMVSEVAYAVRHKTDLSLVLFDLDHFKQVNDRHGHQAGDAVLAHAAGLVHPRLRLEDVFARYGGEEFAIILRGIDLPGAARVGERIRTAVSAKPAVFESQLIPVTLSAGAACLACSESQSPDELLAAADRRLYLAKGAGRNRVVSVG